MEQKEKKTVYFTFDEGLSEVSSRLLEILRENRIKASFFVKENNKCSQLLKMIRQEWTDLCKEIFTPRRILLITLGTFIVSFGLYNIHDQTNITEGGALGTILLLEHWFGMKASVASPLIDAACYLVSAKTLGRRFLITSAYSTAVMALIFKLLECFPPLIPDLSAYPLAAALSGALFVGIGVGIVIRCGGSCGGDDALALFISKRTGWRISRCYMFTDFVVLLLSLTYIPAKRIFYSLLTVTVSSLLIEYVTRVDIKNENVRRRRK